MITTAREPRRGGRVVRIAIAASLLVHVLAALFVLGAYESVERLLAHIPTHHRQREPDETVVLSTALHIERRTRAAQSQHSRGAASPPQRHHARVAFAPPRAAVAPRKVPVPHPTVEPTPVTRKELAKILPRARPRLVATAPRPIVPTPRSVPAEGKRLALAEHPAAQTSQQRPATSARYSAAQLAAIQNNLAKAISNDRAADDPLSNVKHQLHPATSHRSAINFLGAQGKLNGFEGLCEPLRSWTTGAYVHFYVTCRTTHDDGTVRQEAIPWPLTYSARRVAYDIDGPVLPPGEVPPPDPSWHPDPSERLDPDVIIYLRKKGYRM